MRAGETERAAAEYLLAAEEKAAACHFVAAADLALRAQRPDLMWRYLTVGWQRRPWGDAAACLMRLTELVGSYPLDSLRENRPFLLKLIDEANDYFAQGGAEQQAADFYNLLATLAGQKNLEPARDELLDRALLGLAGKLRQSAGSANRADIVSRLFGSAGPWEPALVRDADVAVRGVPRSSRVRSDARRMKTHAGRVTAACAARESGDLFLGFADGWVAHLHPRRAANVNWKAPGDRVVSIVTDAGAGTVVLLAECKEAHEYRAATFLRRGPGYNPWNHTVFHARCVPSVSAIASRNGEQMVALLDGQQVEFRSLPDLLLVGRLDHSPDCSAALLLDDWPTIQKTLDLPFFAPSSLFQDGPPMFSWLAPSRTSLEMVFTDDEGALHWLVLRVLTDDPAVLADHRSRSVFRCATLLKPGHAAAVQRDGVAWLARGERGYYQRTHTPLDLHDAVACFASPVTNELLVVAAEGDVVRVSAPMNAMVTC
jgi:hypothetical protein